MTRPIPVQHPRLTTVLPAYNELEALPRALSLYFDAFRASRINDFEIIIVNDASTDGTGELANDLARKHKNVRVIHHKHNQGQSAAFLHGFRQARGDILTWNGADLPFHPKDVTRALACFDCGADVVIVERANRRAYGPVRKIVSLTNVALLRLLFRSPVEDFNFVQFFRREVIQSVPVISTGVSCVAAELIIRSMRAGHRTVRISAEYHGRTTGKSTITPRKILQALLETVRLRWRIGSSDDLNTNGEAVES